MRRIWWMLALGALLLAACAGASAPEDASGGAAPMEAPMPAEAPAMDRASGEALPLESGAVPVANPAAGGNNTADGTRLIIRTATLALEVESTAVAEASIRASAAANQGYVVSVETSGSVGYEYTIITIRVPAERFDAVLGGVEGLASRVMSRSISGQDVTEEYVDLESRLRNLEATRTRLLDLLERANRVEDALNVNNALTDVQGQIELITGRMQYLRQSSAMSTITAQLQPVRSEPIIEEGGWRPLEVAADALGELVSLGQELISLLIVIAVFTPVWLPSVLLVRWLLRRRRKGAAAPPPPPPAG
jgi:hypothetical protein